MDYKATCVTSTVWTMLFVVKHLVYQQSIVNTTPICVICFKKKYENVTQYKYTMIRKLLVRLFNGCFVTVRTESVSGNSRDISQDALTIQRLSTQTFTNTPLFSLQGVDTIARVVNVKDGDSLTLIIPYNDTFYKFNVRLHEIDTCEMNSTIKENKTRALQARNRVLILIGAIPDSELNIQYTRQDIITMLTTKPFIVRVHCYKFEKYGRLLAEVFPYNSKESLSTSLLKEKYAYKYGGGKRLSEQQQNTIMKIM